MAADPVKSCDVLFARGIYVPELVTELLEIAGFPLSKDDLERIGREIYQDKYRFKLREGFSLDKLRLPARILDAPSPIKGWDEAYLRSALAHVKKILQAN